MGFVGDQVSTICCMDVRAVQIYIASTIKEIVCFEFWAFGLVVSVWVGDCEPAIVMSSAAVVRLPKVFVSPRQ